MIGVEYYLNQHVVRRRIGDDSSEAINMCIHQLQLRESLTELHQIRNDVPLHESGQHRAD